jgi:hypothetical protein
MYICAFRRSFSLAQWKGFCCLYRDKVERYIWLYSFFFVLISKPSQILTKIPLHRSGYQKNVVFTLIPSLLSKFVHFESVIRSVATENFWLVVLTQVFYQCVDSSFRVAASRVSPEYGTIGDSWVRIPTTAYGIIYGIYVVGTYDLICVVIVCTTYIEEK